VVTRPLKVRHQGDEGEKGADEGYQTKQLNHGSILPIDERATVSFGSPFQRTGACRHPRARRRPKRVSGDFFQSGLQSLGGLEALQSSCCLGGSSMLEDVVKQLLDRLIGEDEPTFKPWRDGAESTFWPIAAWVDVDARPSPEPDLRHPRA